MDKHAASASAPSWVRLGTEKVAASTAPLVVKHQDRPQWGLGYLVEERDDRRTYEFEDGNAHAIAKPFWSRLEKVELPEGDRVALEQRAKGQRERASTPSKAKVRAVVPPPMSFDEQLARFDAMFPGGFRGEAFTKDERGAEAPADQKKRPKAFKESAVQAARELLAKDALEAAKAANDVSTILTRARQVQAAASTLLHPVGDLIPFAKMGEEHHARVAEALVDVLHGTGDRAERFERYARALGDAGVLTWPLATVTSALFAPEREAFVKPSFYEKQASIVGFALKYERVPSGAAYGRMVELAELVGQKLRERGHDPRDLLDVYSFIWRTLSGVRPKPKAKAAATGPEYDDD